MAPPLFAVLDAARLGNVLPEARQLNPDNQSLYTGRSADLLANYAPYLFAFDPKHAFSGWFFANGWGNAWGIFCQTAASGQDLHRHFRRFLMVDIEESQPIYFRFYDPRVLRQFLPTCTASQLQDFFGPINYIWLEDDDPAFGLYFWLEQGQLTTHRVSRPEMEETFNHAEPADVPNQ